MRPDGTTAEKLADMVLKAAALLGASAYLLNASVDAFETAPTPFLPLTSLLAVLLLAGVGFTLLVQAASLLLQPFIQISDGPVRLYVRLFIVVLIGASVYVLAGAFPGGFA